jgi:hypothetical protein
MNIGALHLTARYAGPQVNAIALSRMSRLHRLGCCQVNRRDMLDTLGRLICLGTSSLMIAACADQPEAESLVHPREGYIESHDGVLFTGGCLAPRVIPSSLFMVDPSWIMPTWSPTLSSWQTGMCSSSMTRGAQGGRRWYQTRHRFASRRTLRILRRSGSTLA